MADKKLAALQDEIKLLKGEVKQSLASVRDYLLNMELPSAEISTILQALGAEGEQRVTMRGSFEMPTNQKPKESLAEVEEEDQAEPDNIFTTEEETYTDEEESDDASVVEEEEPDDASLVEEEEEVPPPAPRNAGTGSMAGDTEADILPDEEPEPLPEEEEPLDEIDETGETDEEMEPLPGSGLDDDEGEPLAMDNYRGAENDILSAVPKVNMMANLITWVSRAIREIGHDQLPVFLEVYGVSGHLSPEMKDVILHLAELSGDQPEVNTNAGIWSEQMLSLHGILTGGETPLHPVIPSWGAPGDISDQIADEEIMAPEEAPVKLKLVFPDANGESREYSIDLAPGALTDPGSRDVTDR